MIIIGDIGRAFYVVQISLAIQQHKSTSRHRGQERDDGIHGRKQINAWSVESLRKKVPADLLLVPLLTFLCAMSTSFLVQNSIKIIIISS